MGFIFFIPLVLIAFHESTFDNRKYLWMESFFRGENEGSQDRFENRNPQVSDHHCEGLEISKVPFDQLIKAFPKTNQVRKKSFFPILTLSISVSFFKMIIDIKILFFIQSSEESILKEVRDIKIQLRALMEKLDKLHS
jgi:hypothetical protein